MKFKKIFFNKLFFIILMFLGSCVLRAATDTDLGGVADNVRGSTGGILTLIFSMSVIAGLCFAVASVFKFKHHKDSPTQVTVGQPIALLMLGAAMIWLPYIIKSVGVTITGARTEAELHEEQSTIDGNPATGFRSKLISE